LESSSPCFSIFLGWHGNFWQQTKPTIISYFLSKLVSRTFPSFAENTQQLAASMGNKIHLFLSFPFHSNHPWLLPF